MPGLLDVHVNEVSGVVVFIAVRTGVRFGLSRGREERSAIPSSP